MAMALLLEAVERALLVAKWENSIDASVSPVIELARKTADGDIEHTLTSPEVLAVLRARLTNVDLANQPFESWFSFAPLKTFSAEENELLFLVIGIACLHAFVQINWTGPDLPVTPADILFGSIEPGVLSEESLNHKAVRELAYGGEPAYHLAKAATFLRLSQLSFALPYKLCRLSAWWQLRAIQVHQNILDETVALPDSATSVLQPLYSSIVSNRDLAGQLALEQGLLHHHLGQDKLASELFVQAARYTGLNYELTGALGKRTKFQQTELSQLVLLAESRDRKQTEGNENLVPSNHNNNTSVNNRPEIAVDSAALSTSAKLPDTLLLNDDTLLEHTEFTSSSPGNSGSTLGHLNPSSQPPLNPLDQCILLCLCLNVQNTSPAHGLTTEQMSPYVERVISHPQNWSVHTMALLLRSRLESTRTRTVERSTLQLQALIDQMPTTDSSLPERLLYFHSLPLPSKWELERELAMRLLSLGVIKSALEIFQRLEMWEEVVKCWQALERPDMGISIVRDLLEGRKEESETIALRGKASTDVRRQLFDSTREAKLWCLLGDLESKSSFEHYNRAWVISKETSGRAMRSLGGYHFTHGDYTNAIDCLQKAVAINPLLSRPWFILGCSAIKLERWDDARKAFARCVAIDDEDGESWNNLATVYLRMNAPAIIKEDDDKDIRDDKNGSQSAVGASSEVIPLTNKLLAFRALQIGLKYNYDNWRMWTNYMIVAIDVGEFAEACRAQTRIVEEQSSKAGIAAVDEDILDRLVDAVTHKSSTTEDKDGEERTIVSERSINGGKRLLPRMMELFENTILPRMSSQRIFRSYARLLTWQEKWSEALKAYLDGYRLSNAATMQKGDDIEVTKWKEAVAEVEEIVDLLRNFGPRAEEETSHVRNALDSEKTNKIAQEDKVGGGLKWSSQARTIVRSFVTRTRDAFEDDPYWEKLIQLQEELKR